MARVSVIKSRTLSATVVVGLAAVAAWNLTARVPAQIAVPAQIKAPAPVTAPVVSPNHPPAPNKGAMMQHSNDLFRSAKAEVVANDWDQRLKPQVTYSPIGDDAIIQGDIVIGKLADVRKRRLYGYSEDVKHLGDINSLGLSPAQKNLLQAMNNIDWPDDFKAAAKHRDKSRALRIIANLIKFEDQAKDLKDFPETAIAELKRQVSPNIMMAAAIIGAQYRWPNGVIPYTIDGDVPNSQFILDAIAQWHTQTDRINLRPKVDADVDYVRFVLGGGCSSPVGRIGGEQLITLAGGCLAPQIIHEIGHAVGLWHEQCRNDRDSYIIVQDENVDPEMIGNFDPAGAAGQDIGPFDFGSIMLYPSWAFSDNGMPTMVSRFPEVGTNWGVGAPNITKLSLGDLDGVNWMYHQAANPPNPLHPAVAATGTVPPFAPAAPQQLVPIPGVRNQGRKVLAPLAPPSR